MKVRTDSERVRHSRKLVLELLASSVDMSLVSDEVKGWMEHYEAKPERFGPSAPRAAAGERDGRHAGHHHAPEGSQADTVRQPVKIHDEMYVRDYGRCILCYKCVEACGVDAQNTFAISVAGRGFDAGISTEFDTRLDDSACVLLRQLYRRLPHRRADCSKASTIDARPAPGTSRNRASRAPSVLTAAWGATSSCVFRTTRSSKSRRRRITM